MFNCNTCLPFRPVPKNSLLAGKTPYWKNFQDNFENMSCINQFYQHFAPNVTLIISPYSCPRFSALNVVSFANKMTNHSLIKLCGRYEQCNAVNLQKLFFLTDNFNCCEIWNKHIFYCGLISKYVIICLPFIRIYDVIIYLPFIMIYDVIIYLPFIMIYDVIIYLPFIWIYDVIICLPIPQLSWRIPEIMGWLTSTRKTPISSQRPLQQPRWRADWLSKSEHRNQRWDGVLRGISHAGHSPTGHL